MSSCVRQKKNQKGFSLIEILIVVALIGIIAAIGSPVFQDARINAQRSAALSSLRRIYGAETSYRVSFSRYANMQELNTYQNSGFGETVAPDKVFKSGYTYQWLSPTPSVSNVETGFQIQANGHTNTGAIEAYLLHANGSIEQRLPVIRDIVRFQDTQ